MLPVHDASAPPIHLISSASPASVGAAFAPGSTYSISGILEITKGSSKHRGKTVPDLISLSKLELHPCQKQKSTVHTEPPRNDFTIFKRGKNYLWDLKHFLLVLFIMQMLNPYKLSMARKGKEHAW